MLFTNLVSTLATACAILVPVAMAEDGIKAQAGDFEIKWHGRKSCGDNGGPRRQLFKGVCVPLADTTHSVKVLDHRVGTKSKSPDRYGSRKIANPYASPRLR